MSDIVSELQKKDTIESYKNKKKNLKNYQFFILTTKKSNKRFLIVRSRYGVKLGSISIPSIKSNYTVLITANLDFVLFVPGVRL